MKLWGLVAMVLVGCGGEAAKPLVAVELTDARDAAPMTTAVTPVATVDAGAPDAAPVDAGDPACDKLGRYVDAIMAAKCVHVITIVPGESCADTVARIDACVAGAACRKTMAEACGGKVPELG